MKNIFPTFEEIDQGYIFTNKNNHLASSREEVYNPYLQFLLDQVNRQHYDYLDILDRKSVV